MKKPLPQKRASKAPLPSQKNGDASTPVMVYIGVFGICAYLLLVGLAQIFLQNKIATIENDITAEKKNLKIILKVRNNLQMEREQHMTAAYIEPRARRLGLGPAAPGQIRKMPSVPINTLEHENLVDRID